MSESEPTCLDHRPASSLLASFFEQEQGENVQAYPWVLTLVAALNYGTTRLQRASTREISWLDRDIDLAVFPRHRAWSVAEARTSVLALLSRVHIVPLF